MKEQQIVGVGNKAGVRAPIIEQTREPRRPNRQGLAQEGLLGDLVVKPVKELVKSVLPPEMQEALGIQEAPKQEKKPPIIIVVFPGQNPETTSPGTMGTIRHPVTSRIADRPTATARQLPGTGAS